MVTVGPRRGAAALRRRGCRACCAGVLHANRTGWRVAGGRAKRGSEGEGGYWLVEAARVSTGRRRVGKDGGARGLRDVDRPGRL